MFRYSPLLLLVSVSLPADMVWTVRVEEPTGIERRTSELVRVPLSKLSAGKTGFRAVDSKGTELPVQLTKQELLFPASVMAGQVTEYRIICCGTATPSNAVYARRLPSGRFELKNEFARIVLDAETGYIVEAYHLGAGPQRIVNLVETTPTVHDPNDIHPKPPESITLSGANTGWISLGGAVHNLSLESGPLEGRIVGNQYELRLAGNRLTWTTAKGFRFASISALPYMPFDSCTDGDEYKWPTGPDPSMPPDSAIGSRTWTTPPGGLFTYYARKENYGAISFLPLTPLKWSGACTNRVEAQTSNSAVVTILFHQWKGDDTALVARSEGRKVRQPLLVEISGPRNQTASVSTPQAPESTAAYAPVQQPPVRFEPKRFSLDGEWELAWGNKGEGPNSEWRTVRVPGTVHLQWLPATDIYKHEAAWVSQKEWWYRRKFRVPAEMKGWQLRLEFEATDYYAEAFLDGVRVGRHEGYVDPYGYDVTPLLKPGTEHELRVRVWTPVHYYWKHRPYTVKGSYGGVDQKPDDITALGITRSVSLRAWKQARITDVAISTNIEAGEGIVTVDVESEGQAASELTLTDPRGGAGIRALRQTGSHFEFRIKDPKLWSTWDHGQPNLYTLDIRLIDEKRNVLDAKQSKVGIRTITRKADKFYLNGKPIFLRGTNTYANLWLSESNREHYQRDLAIIRQMNVNSIRLHCHFENPEFYELADEQGFLVWQDFLEAWYPHDTEFSRHAAELYDNHIRLVRNHASVFTWATSDEEDHENYRDLTKHLAARASLLDPQDRWVQRSTGRHGDAHLYFGWYDGSIWDYRNITANLVTELGATALPAVGSLDKFLHGKWPIPDHAPDWQYHRLQVPEAAKAWGDLSKLSVEQAVDISQTYAARLFQIAIERVRRRKEEGAGGIFHFYAIDMWPSITMGAVDFYRVPSKVHATVARSFEPVAVSLDFDRAEWKRGETVKVGVWGINDRHDTIGDAQIRWRLDSAEGVFRHTFPPDSSRRVGEIEWPASKPGDYTLHAEVWQADRRISANDYRFRVQ